MHEWRNLLRAVFGFTFVLGVKVIGQPIVQVVSINLPEIDMESGFYGVLNSAQQD